jgi:hypothetical protein
VHRLIHVNKCGFMCVYLYNYLINNIVYLHSYAVIKMVWTRYCLERPWRCHCRLQQCTYICKYRQCSEVSNIPLVADTSQYVCLGTFNKPTARTGCITPDISREHQCLLLMKEFRNIVQSSAHFRFVKLNVYPPLYSVSQT